MQSKKKIMITTFGIFLVNNKNQLLVVHPTGHPLNKNWSIPKGLMDENDNSGFSAAVRELEEETGISLDFSKVKKTSENQEVSYSTSEKLLKSWIIFVDDDFDNVELKCKSTFEYDGIDFPENDYICWVPVDFNWKPEYNHVNLHPTQERFLPLLQSAKFA